MMKFTIMFSFDIIVNFIIHNYVLFDIIDNIIQKFARGDKNQIFRTVCKYLVANTFGTYTFFYLLTTEFKRRLFFSLIKFSFLFIRGVR